MGKLLDKLSSLNLTLDPNSDEACLIRVTHRDYERPHKIQLNFWLMSSATFLKPIIIGQRHAQTITLRKYKMP